MKHERRKEGFGPQGKINGKYGYEHAKMVVKNLLPIAQTELSKMRLLPKISGKHNNNDNNGYAYFFIRHKEFGLVLKVS